MSPCEEMGWDLARWTVTIYLAVGLIVYWTGNLAGNLDPIVVMAG